jgi:hypothetical protein
MCEQFTDGSRVWGWPKTVFFFREVLSNRDRILADGAKTPGQFRGSIVIHALSPLVKRAFVIRRWFSPEV